MRIGARVVASDWLLGTVGDGVGEEDLDGDGGFGGGGGVEGGNGEAGGAGGPPGIAKGGLGDSAAGGVARGGGGEFAGDEEFAEVDAEDFGLLGRALLRVGGGELAG